MRGGQDQFSVVLKDPDQNQDQDQDLLSPGVLMLLRLLLFTRGPLRDS